MATEKELKEEIIRLRMDILLSNLNGIGYHYCHYAYYPTKNKNREQINCNELDCDECRAIWKKEMIEEITEEVMRM